MSLPILYSLRNCPYAIRARIAIYKTKRPMLLRDIVLTDKPKEMILASPKGTVPVLVLPDGHVIEESLEVMLWALAESDPDDLLHKGIYAEVVSEVKLGNEMLQLINDFDNGFKTSLEQYKCAKRYREENLIECREVCQIYLTILERRLTTNTFLMSNKESLADIAIFPFIRQFAKVERKWYQQSRYQKVKAWLNNYLQSKMFSKVMAEHSLWVNSREDVLFGYDIK